MRGSIITDLGRGGAVKKLMVAFGCQGYEATLSDLVAVTGISAYEVEDAVRVMSRRYGGSHRVTESGEIVYKFPHAFREARPSAVPMSAVGTGLSHAAQSFVRWMVERWPVVLLGGYFTVFLALPFPPALIALALLLGTWSDLAYIDTGGDSRSKWRASRLRIRETLHEYLFGVDTGSQHWEERRLFEVLSFVRDHKGIVSSREISQLTGQSPAETQEYLGRLLLTYSGEPKVTELATVVYRFPELMRTMASARRPHICGNREPDGPGESLGSEEGHRRRTRIISLANFANLLFGFYYGLLSFESMVSGAPLPGVTGDAHQAGSFLFDATYSFIAGSQFVATLPAMFVFMGALPFGIATTFLVLHRRARRRKAKWRREAEERRLRKAVYAHALRRPQWVDPQQILLSEGLARRKGARKAVVAILDELASTYHGEIDDIGKGHFVYHFPEIERESRELDGLREAVDPSVYDAGRVVFDSRARVR